MTIWIILHPFRSYPLPPVYQAVLTRTYLTTKIMPLLAAVAVTLCCAMVLIVWSVMGGFLVKLLESGQKYNGDVTIVWPNQGFAHYEDLINRLEADTGFVRAAAPMIETVGMVTLPDDRMEMTRVRGIDPVRYARVADFHELLHWKPLSEPVAKDREGHDPRLDPEWRGRMQRALDEGLRLSKADPATGRQGPAVVAGIEMLGLSQRQPGAWYDFRPMPWVKIIGAPQPDGSVRWLQGFVPDRSITVRLLPLDLGGREIESIGVTLPIANEFRSGVFEQDKRTLVLPLDELQRLMKMDAATRAPRATTDIYDTTTPIAGQGEEPARVTTVLVRAAEGVTPEALLARVEAIYQQWAAAHRGVPAFSVVKDRLIRTWRMEKADMVDAVENETGMVLMLLSFISLTASFLILAVFWAMVSEKTKDVGVLRALGASRLGVAWIWLRYGLVIGVIGSLAGGALAWVIVTNINEIHEWLGTNLGIVVWKPSVYAFAEIPSRVNPRHAVFVLVGGVALSLLGALVPAWRAATMDPVRALRFE